jgi:transposase-like protein
MIHAKISHHCAHCQSKDIIKNRHNAKGKQQYRCKDCARDGVLTPTVPHTEADTEQIINAYYERPSMRGIERIFGVARQTIAVWLKKAAHAPTIPDTLATARPDDTFELDEMFRLSMPVRTNAGC